MYAHRVSQHGTHGKCAIHKSADFGTLIFAKHKLGCPCPSAVQLCEVVGPTRVGCCLTVSSFAAAGLIGTAPSAELLAIWNERERKLNADGPDAVTLGGTPRGSRMTMLCMSAKL